jgi:hypothetical protein
MYLAGRAWDAAWANAADAARQDFRAALTNEVPSLGTDIDTDVASFEEEVRWAVMGVGLLHDVGHPPFSHVLESVYEEHAEDILDGPDRDALLRGLRKRNGQFHEAAGEHLLSQHVLPRLSALTKDLLRAVYLSDPGGDSAASTLHSIVSGELDVDRLDYLLRDSERAGTEFGAIDWERLVDAYRLRTDDAGQSRILPTMRAQSAAESLLVQRVQAYRWVIYHHRVVGTNTALANALSSLLHLIQDGEGYNLGGGRVNDVSDMTPPRVSVAEILAPSLQNLNYLDPGADSIARAAGRAYGSTKTAPGEPEAVALSMLTSQILSDMQARELICASADDSAVVRSLLDARMLAAPLAERLPLEVGQRLRLFVAFVDAALMRSKNFISIWKSEREFAASAETIWSTHGVGVAVEAAFDGAKNAHGEPFVDRDSFDRLTIPGRVNVLLLNAVQSPALRERLQTAIWEDLPILQSRAPGAWRVTPVRFAAVARGSKAGRLWDDAGKPFVLSESSQLVRALQTVDEQRPKVGFFYFISDARAAGDMGLQATLRLIALEAVVRVTASHLKDTLAETFLAGPDSSG